MKKGILSIIVVLSFLLFAITAGAVPINPDFSDYPSAPTSTGSVDLDTVAANTWFNDNYGITFSDVYLYYDTRDTYDHVGIANDVGGSGIGWVYFTDTTNFVTVDWITISSQDIYLDVFDASNNLLDSYFHAGSATTELTATLTGTGIASLRFHDSGGQVGLSTLLYDYDGTTDGTNTDTQVPEPATMLLLGLGLMGLAGIRKKL